MRHCKLLLSAALALALAAGCSSGKSDDAQKTIAVDADAAVELDLRASVAGVEHITLESSVEAFSANVLALYKVGDTLVRIGREKVSAFDGAGKYLFECALKGPGPQEFTSMNNVAFRDGILYLYDFNLSRLLKFGVDGRFIESLDVKRDENKYSPSKIFPMPRSDGYMAMISYRGEEFFTPLFGLYDKDLNPLQFTREPRTHSWLTQGNQFAAFEDGFYIIDIFSYDLFYVDSRMEPVLKYTIDFGKYAIPSHIYEKGANEIYRELISGDESFRNKIGNVTFLNVTEDRLFFTFSYLLVGGMKIVSYDKASGTAAVFAPKVEPNLKLTSFFGIQGDKAILVAENTENPEENFTLIFFPLSKLQ